MRQVVLQFWISLDGYSCDPDTEFYRQFEEISDDRLDEYMVAALRRVGTHVMGRATYQGMAEYFRTSTDPIAAPLNDIPKVVFSSTLQSVDWPGTQIVSGDTAQEIARLRRQPGGQILVHGGASFAHSLIRLGLVDEYRLFVLPFAVAGGTPLFTGLASPLALSLVSSTAFPSGTLVLVYRPADAKPGPAVPADSAG